MARENAVDEHYLSSEFTSTHAMWRIGLSPDDLRDLSAYINSAALSVSSLRLARFKRTRWCGW
jgi:hypothetical protein